MLFTVYGSCQADAIAKSLLIFPEFNERFDYIEIPTCFNSSSEQLKHICNEILPKVDLFIHQNIAAEYRGYEFSSENLSNHLKSNCIKVSLQYLHWEGYQPFHYAAGTNSKSCPYSDYLIMQFIDDNMNHLDYMRKLPEITYFINENIQLITNWCSSQLEIRSQNKAYDITLTDFIKNNWLELKLFHTMNHPTGFLLFKAAEQILDLISIKRTGVRFKDAGRFDPLDTYKLPILTNPFSEKINKEEILISMEKFNFLEYIKLEFDEISKNEENMKSKINSFHSKRPHLSYIFNSLKKS